MDLPNSLELEEVILLELRQAEKAPNSKGAVPILEHAERLYRKLGYSFEVECNINQTYFLVMDGLKPKNWYLIDFICKIVKYLYHTAFSSSMPDILDLIQSRRSVKKFLPKFVSWDNIAKVIGAGRHAPSSGNLQNWKFIVIMEPDAKESLIKHCYEQYELSSAGALIVVCGEPEKCERYYGEKGVKKYTIQNCAAAIENMLLEAHSLGLGSCWVGAYDEEEVKLLLKIPEEVTVEGIVAIGYAQEIPEKPPKYPLETVVYFHQWRNKMRDPAKYMNDIATILARRRESVSKAMQNVTGKIETAAHSVAEKLKKKDVPWFFGFYFNNENNYTIFLEAYGTQHGLVQICVP